MSDATAEMKSAPARPFRARRVVLLVLLGAAALIAANIHLVYVAVTSQPDCVVHVKRGDSNAGTYGAARPAC